MSEYPDFCATLDVVPPTAFDILIDILVATWLFALVAGIFICVCLWKIYQKANEPGWKCLIPYYNNYTLFQILYNNGWLFLLLIVPFLNIFVYIKMNIDLAKVFGQSTAFGVGCIFLPIIFYPILAFKQDIQYVGYTNLF